LKILIARVRGAAAYYLVPRPAPPASPPTSNLGSRGKESVLPDFQQTLFSLQSETRNNGGSLDV